MIDRSNYRKNLYSFEELLPCPGYGEDGVLTKLFQEIGVSSKPFCIEFGELRVLGSTTRSYRIDNFADAKYFSLSLDWKSRILNILDIFKIVAKRRNVKYLKFFLSQPRKKKIYQGEVMNTLNLDLRKEIDLLVIDIDSFDYEIIKEIFLGGILPKVFVVEYNPNFPVDEVYYVTYQQFNDEIKNKRIYGASFVALKNLLESFGYSLVHISGFCYLIFCREENKARFTTPNFSLDITDSDEKVARYAETYCTEGFVPNWLMFPPLTENDVRQFRH